MEGPLAALDPHQAVLPIIALLGLVPVLLHYRNQSKWYVIAYGFLIVATLSTNLESLFLGTVLNYAEHLLGLMGSGIAFFAAGYLRWQHLQNEETTTDESITTDSSTTTGV
ncbi:MAG: hypothetical protein ABEJ48_06550 [Halobacteriales archaeon]